MKYNLLHKRLAIRSRKFLRYWAFLILLLPLLVAGSAIAIHPDYQRLTHSSLRQFRGEILIAQDCRDAEIGEVRAPTDPLIPYIISPRRTFLLNNQPKLRWNKVPGFNNYIVSLVKGDRPIWETTINGNEVVYPGEPKLESGVEYSVVVKAENGKSSEEEKLTNREFKLLPKAEAKMVQNAISQLNKQPTIDKTKALLRAYLYIGIELKSEAIDTLEALVNAGTQEATIYRRLGELYWQSGLTLWAESNYLEAVKRATDLGEQAQVQIALGEMYIAINNQSEAARWLSLAMNSYKSLGNMQRVKELETQITKLKMSL